MLVGSSCISPNVIVLLSWVHVNAVRMSINMKSQTTHTLDTHKGKRRIWRTCTASQHAGNTLTEIHCTDCYHASQTSTMPLYSCFPTLIYVNSNSNYRQTMQAHLPPSNIRIEGTLLGALQGSSEKISPSKSSCPIDRARTGLSLDTLHILGKSSWTAAEAYLAARWWPRLSRCISATPCPSPFDGSFCHSMAVSSCCWPSHSRGHFAHAHCTIATTKMAAFVAMCVARASWKLLLRIREIT